MSQLPAAQYFKMKELVRGVLSVEGVGPSDKDVLAFFAQLFLATGNPITPPKRLFLMSQTIKAALSGDGVAPSDADVLTFWSQINTDSLGATPLSATRYLSMFNALTARMSCDGINPNAADVKGYFDVAVPLAFYTGQVATRCGIGTSIVGTPGNTYMLRTAHVAMDDITSLQLVEANWYVSNTEINGPSTMTITAGIEFPSSTFTQVKYSGIAAGSVAGGVSLVSDACTVTIPKGSTFFVRRFLNSASGTPYNSGGNFHTPALGDAVEINSTDKTISGTLVNQQVAWSMFPAAIIALTARISVAAIGDSRCAGAGSYENSNTTADTARGEICRTVGVNYGFINLGVSGDTAQGFVASHAKRVALAQYCSTVICEYGINDMVIVLTVTAAQHQVNCQTIRGYFAAGTPFYVCTLPPVTTSTDSWATLINQTVNARDSVRVTWNNLVRANLGLFTRGIELADTNESSRDSGLWAVNGTANWLVGDGTHENSFGDSRYFVTIP